MEDKFKYDKEYFEFLQEANKKATIDTYDHNLQPGELDNMIAEVKKKDEEYEKAGCIPTLTNEEAYDLIKKELDELLEADSSEVTSNPEKYRALYSNIVELYYLLRENSRWYIKAKQKVMEVGNKYKELYDLGLKITDEDLDTTKEVDTSEIDETIKQIDEKLTELEKENQ